MSVVGIDLGARGMTVAQAGRGGIDIIRNENSNYSSLVAVAIQGKERFLGDAAAPLLRSGNCAQQLKMLLGRDYEDQELQEEVATFGHATLARWPEGSEEGGGDGDGGEERSGFSAGIVMEYGEERKVFSAPEVTAMLLVKAQRLIAGAATSGKARGDAVVGVPSWFTIPQRRAVLDACALSGIAPLQLMPEGSAVALGYGFFRDAKEPFPADKDSHVLFVDMGYSHVTATVAAYRNGKCVILGMASTLEAGGRWMDAKLAKLLADRFSEQNGGLDCWGKPKARKRLLELAERIKTTLSPYGVDQAPASVECLTDDRDLRGDVTLAEFEQVIEPVVEAIRAPVREALRLAGLKSSDLSKTEIVGGCSRVRAARRVLALELGMTLDEPNGHGFGTSLNADEAVARGLALRCAQLSPLFKVKDYDFADRVPRAVRLSWDASPAEEGGVDDAAAAAAAAASGEEGSATPSASAGKAGSNIIFGVGDPCPVVRRTTFRRTKDFCVHVSYTDEKVDEGGDGEGGENAEDAAASSAAASGGGSDGAEEEDKLGTYRICGFPGEDKSTARRDALARGWTPRASKVRLDLAYTASGTVEVNQVVLLRDMPPPPDIPDSEPEDEVEEEKKEDGSGDGEGEGEGAAASAAASAESGEGGETTEGGEKSEDGKVEDDEEAKKKKEAEEKAAKKKKEAEEKKKREKEERDRKRKEAREFKPKWTRTELRAVPVGSIPGALTRSILERLARDETAMQKEDDIIAATHAKRNELEAFIYKARDDFGDGGELRPFVDRERADEFVGGLMDEEDWVCYGDGCDADLDTLSARLTNLQSFTTPAYKRKWEAEHRDAASAELVAAIERYQEISRSTDQTYDHLEESDRDTLRAACREAEVWLRKAQDDQMSLRGDQDPAFTVADIRKHMDTLKRECEPIATRPKPAPKKESEEKKEDGSDSAADSAAAEGGGKGGEDAATEDAGTEAEGGEGEGEGADAAASAAASAATPSVDGEGEETPVDGEGGDTPAAESAAASASE